MSAKPDSANVLPPQRLLQAAQEAIDSLKISKFITDHETTLFERLLEADKNAEAAPVDADMLFIVLSLPVASSVIHLASDRESLADAREWAGRIWPKADPIPILSTLTLVDIVRRGYYANKKAAEPNAVWDRIAHRVKKLTEEMAEQERLAAGGA